MFYFNGRLIDLAAQVVGELNAQDGICRDTWLEICALRGADSDAFVFLMDFTTDGHWHLREPEARS